MTVIMFYFIKIVNGLFPVVIPTQHWSHTVVIQSGKCQKTLRVDEREQGDSCRAPAIQT